MVAVLMGSCKVGRTSWAAVRGRKKIRVQGVCEGDSLRIVMRGERGDHSLDMIECCVLDIPEGIQSIRAEHIKISGSPVFIDLV